MPYVTNGSRRLGRAIATAVGLALMTTAPAAAAEPTVKGAATNPDGCVVSHSLTNPFTAFGDLADYALAPGGDFETAAQGWTLTKDASVTAITPGTDAGKPPSA